MKNNEYKVIRTINLKHYNMKGNVIEYDPAKEDEIKNYVADSELLRIAEALDGYREEDGRKYLPGVIAVKVGDYTADVLYKKIEDNSQVLILNHGKRRKQKDGTYIWKEEGTKENFVRMVVNSSHIRQKKAIFVKADLYNKIHKILLGGIDEFADINHYPIYKKGAAKWSAYYGLACTDSKAVTSPNIIVVDDYKKDVTDTFDVVTQHKSIDEDWREEDGLKNKYIKTYSVDRGAKRTIEIIPFDGAGLVSIKCAKKWCNDLGIKGYIPAAWQFRAIPGIKGNLYTFDIEAFGRENGYIITDIMGVQHDIREERIDAILTKSQTKFLDLFENDIGRWRTIFDKPVIFYKKDTDEIECQYRRTFNICDYSENPKELDAQTRSAYQHLQTVEFTDDERQTYIQKTIDRFAEISTDADKFLKYRGCLHSDENTHVPPYYIVASKMEKIDRDMLFADSFFQRKVKADIKAFKYRALAGKEIIDGNYQVLTPDLYGLAQYCFGERDADKIGILKPYEVYSNWWINYYSDVPAELAIVRNPHIYMEARVVKLIEKSTVTDSVEEQERKDLVWKWFKYQNTGIVTDAFSTVALALGTADFDGDHVQTTNSCEYINAVKRAIEQGNGYTVDWICDGPKENTKSVDVTDIKTLMSYDRLGYSNNIGTIIDKVTILWGIEQTAKNREMLMEYIAIADIIGQLTIDAAKTGEFEKFYEPITEYYKNLGAKTPYFKRYLSKYSDKVAKEKAGVRNAEFYYEDDEDLLAKQFEFSDDATNVNLICHDLEKAFEGIEQTMMESAFDTEWFKKRFVTEDVSVRTELYKRVKEKLMELAEKHSKKSKEDDDKDVDSHFKWYYNYCRANLLKECKLGEKKALEKVLNIIVYLCYCDPEVGGNDNAKAIMWNSFGKELCIRASGKMIEDTTVGKKESVALKRKKASKNKINNASSYPIDIKYVRFTNNMWEYIKSATKTYNVSKSLRKATPKEETKCLRKLAIVLYVLHMSMRKDVKGKLTVRRPAITLYVNTNGKMNKTLLSKICGFNDNQRKKIDEYLKRLAQLGVIEIPKGKMANIRIKMCYDDRCDSGEDLISDDVKESKDLYAISSYLFNKKRL